MLFFLLELTRAFLPKDIKAVIEGSDFVLNIYEFFQWRKSNSYSSIVNEFEFELSDQRLKPLGIKYDSTFANVFSIMITIFLMIFVSTFIYLTKILFKRLKERNKCSCLSKVLFWISDRLSRILILSYFIRNFLEMLQFIMISTIYEIYKNNTTSVYRSISLSFSYLIILMFLLIFIFIQYLTFSSYKLNEGEHNKLEEFFRGIKQNKRHKFYITMLLIRRIVFIILLITCVFIPSIILIVILSIFQAAYVIYLTCLRPYIEIKGNLIEILNELYFSILLIALSILNTESHWTSVKTGIYMWTLVSNTLLIFIIVIAFPIISICKWCLRKCCRKHEISENDNKENYDIRDLNRVRPKQDQNENVNSNHKLTIEKIDQSSICLAPNHYTEEVKSNINA